MCTKYHFTKEGKHTNTCGGRCMRAETMKLRFWQAYRAYVQVYTCTVATSCSSHPPAWISKWFGLSISVYQLVSPVKKFWKQYRWSMDMPGNSISCSPKLLVILWHLWMIQDCPWQHLTYLFNIYKNIEAKNISSVHHFNRKTNLNIVEAKHSQTLDTFL